MNPLEQFFLSHPDLMRMHFDPRPWISAVGALLCLGVPLFMRTEPTNFVAVASPVGALRCFRFCWMAGFPTMVVEAYTSARGIEAQGWVLAFELFFFLLWLVLIVTGIGGILSACFREARGKQRTDSTS